METDQKIQIVNQTKQLLGLKPKERISEASEGLISKTLGLHGSVANSVLRSYAEIAKESNVAESIRINRLINKAEKCR